MGDVGVIVAPDFKRGPRHLASLAEWDTIRDAKAGPCRGCGVVTYAGSFHHLVPRSLGGGDAEDNIVFLCGSGTTGCHGALETHPRGWEQVAHNVRHGLSQAELNYVLDVKGIDFLETYYPMGTPGDELCPRCRRPKGVKLEKPRNRKSLVVKVPDDEQERGADLFEERMELCRVTLERDYDMVFGEGEATRYHILVAVMDVFSGIAG